MLYLFGKVFYLQTYENCFRHEKAS
jgi:hypothetical protein